MTTLKDFEEALREQGMHMALAILDKLRQRDRAKRSIDPIRRVAGRKITPELAQRILELHRTTKMTQQEIAFQLGVNQGRVNEVVKHGKWLSGDPSSPEAVARDRALERAGRGADAGSRKHVRKTGRGQGLRPSARAALAAGRKSRARSEEQGQLTLGDL